MQKSQIINIHVGQCGNQIGRSYWRRLLQEYSEYCKCSMTKRVEGDITYCVPKLDQSMSTVFQNLDKNGRNLPIETPLIHLRARAILIDMEYGVVNETLRSSLSSIFDQEHGVLTDNSGAGNNFAQGFFEYGDIYRERIIDIIRRNVEACDNPGMFQVIHSLGGGTGSGLGSKLFEIISSEFEGIKKVAVSVLPSTLSERHSDDVVVSPYNSVMALNQLSQHADVIIPFSNAQLATIDNGIEHNARKGASCNLNNIRNSRSLVTTQTTSAHSYHQKSSKVMHVTQNRPSFENLNHIVADTLIDITAPSRLTDDKEAFPDLVSSLTSSRMKILSVSIGSQINHTHRTKGAKPIEVCKCQTCINKQQLFNNELTS